jgi:hypothetical protein
VYAFDNRGVECRKKWGLVCKEVVFLNSELEIEHIKELPFNPTDILWAKHAGCHTPVIIF